MSFGRSKKPKKAKYTPAAAAPPAQTVFQGIDSYSVDLGGLASANTRRTPGQISTTSNLAPNLGRSRDLATAGLKQNLSFINRTPTQQLEDLNAGNNTFYNLQAELNRRAAETSLGQAQKRFSSTGLENSTVRGAFEGQLATDSLLKDLATRQSSLEFQNNQALQNINTQNQTLGNLANIQSIPLQLANQNAFQGFSAVDQTSQFNNSQLNQLNQFNAGQKAQFDLYNTQQANAYAQQKAAQRSSLIGNLISAGASLAAIPLTGGLSAIGAAKSFGNILGGASGASGGSSGLAYNVPSVLEGLQNRATSAYLAPSARPIGLGGPFASIGALSTSNPFVGNRVN